MRRRPMRRRAVALAILMIFLCSASLWAETIELPKTGQTLTVSEGDDGYLEMGRAWPSPRFFDNGDGTVTDKLTGLIWLKDANCKGAQSWTDAIDKANSLANGGCSLTDGSKAGDWRLPNVIELASLVDISNDNPCLPSGHPFTSTQSDRYWSSTTNPNPASDTPEAWCVEMYRGDMIPSAWKAGKYYVWPVRSGQDTPVILLPKTGQTTSYGAGDDGNLQKGVAWPNPRFTDNKNGTVTDNLTNLV